MDIIRLGNYPLISLIIPVYNVRPYIKQSLDSVVNQTYNNLSIIIIDDGSTDGSGKICDLYADRYSNITVFHTKNMGLSAARNYGLDRMRPETEYVAFLDSDDWMEKETIEKMFTEAARCHADIVACRYYFEKPRSRRLVDYCDRRLVLKEKQIIRCYLSDYHIGQVAWNKLYRSVLFSDIRYPVGMVFEDIATTCKIIRMSKKVVAIPDILFHYRVRENSISKSFSAKCLEDYWKANYAKYSIYSMIDNDYKNKQMLVVSCLWAINRMWRGYGSFSREEQKSLDGTLNDMMVFVAEYRNTVLQGHYSLFHKLTCLCAMSKNPIYMWIINRIYKVVCIIRKCISPRYK